MWYRCDNPQCSYRTRKPRFCHTQPMSCGTCHKVTRMILDRVTEAGMLLLFAPRRLYHIARPSANYEKAFCGAKRLPQDTVKDRPLSRSITCVNCLHSARVSMPEDIKLVKD